MEQSAVGIEKDVTNSWEKEMILHTYYGQLLLLSHALMAQLQQWGLTVGGKDPEL